MVWAVSLSTTDLSTRSLTPWKHQRGIRGLVGFGTAYAALAHPVPYPLEAITKGCTSMHFGENQLSPALIGLSPLPTAHPSFLHQTPVRTSREFYPSFILSMGRSTGFGSTDTDLTPY